MCPICADERQYIDPHGQRWIDPRAFDGRIALHEIEPDLWVLEVEDGVGIGQHAFDGDAVQRVVFDDRDPDPPLAQFTLGRTLFCHVHDFHPVPPDGAGRPAVAGSSAGPVGTNASKLPAIGGLATPP